MLKLYIPKLELITLYAHTPAPDMPYGLPSGTPHARISGTHTLADDAAQALATCINDGLFMQCAEDLSSYYDRRNDLSTEAAAIRSRGGDASRLRDIERYLRDLPILTPAGVADVDPAAVWRALASIEIPVDLPPQLRKLIREPLATMPAFDMPADMPAVWAIEIDGAAVGYVEGRAVDLTDTQPAGEFSDIDAAPQVDPEFVAECAKARAKHLDKIEKSLEYREALARLAMENRI